MFFFKDPDGCEGLRPFRSANAFGFHWYPREPTAGGKRTIWLPAPGSHPLLVVHRTTWDCGHGFKQLLPGAAYHCGKWDCRGLEHPFQPEVILGQQPRSPKDPNLKPAGLHYLRPGIHVGVDLQGKQRATVAILKRRF